MFDLIIRGGQVLDGTGTPAFRADVGIEGDRITAIGDLSGASANQVIDATGRVVAPGFIDMHTHSDFTLPVNPLAESKVRQGVTTEVVANCGLATAPVSPATQDQLLRYVAFFDPGLTWEWTSLGEFLSFLQGNGIAVNVVPLVAHGAVRIAAMGFSDEAPSTDEMAQMKQLVTQAMDEGAWGLSTGLFYPPGAFAQTDEIVELARVASAKGGLYTSHIRSEGKTLLESIQEVVTIAREANISAEISHFKASGQAHWHKAEQAVALVDEARQQGLPVAADMYPYTAGATTLTALLPEWTQAGGITALLERLHDISTRQAIREEMRHGAGLEGRLDATVIATCSSHPEYEGKRIAEIAEERGRDPEETVLDILAETECRADIVSFMMSEANVKMSLAQPWMTLGSDGSSLAPYGPLGKGKRHPRNYGTFPRVLGQYVREEHVLSLPEAVKRMTSQVADKLGLKDRGRVQTGLAADLVVFNADTIGERGTFENPYQYPSGIEYVFVNGQVVVAQGGHRGVTPGRVLRK